MPRTNHFSSLQYRMQSLDTALNKLNRMLGLNSASAKILGTRLQSYTIRDSEGPDDFFAPLLNALVRNVRDGIIINSQYDSIGSSSKTRYNSQYYRVSQGQMFSDIASAITRASRRYL